MSWDDCRVRIELCDVMTLRDENGAPVMEAASGAEIWLSDGTGKIIRSKKPAMTVTAASRPELLRRLASWIEQYDDPALSLLVAEQLHGGTGLPGSG